jgi:RNA polymerase sigma-70 factor (ECF subfamily)
LQKKQLRMAEKTLARIINGCKNGDSESFSGLVDLYAKRCYGYFYRMTTSKDTSDELLSELFVKLVENIGSYRGGSFDGWIFRVASNVFFDHLRSKHRQQKLLEEKSRRLETEPSEIVPDRDERIDKLQMEIAKLDDDTRELIMLRYYSQLSFKEIAEMRAEPIGTTLSKVHRGLQKLRELME